MVTIWGLISVHQVLLESSLGRVHDPLIKGTSVYPGSPIKLLVFYEGGYWHPEKTRPWSSL